MSLLAGIDLVTGKVHALVKDRHRSREFIEFLKLLDNAYPTDTAITPDPRQSFRAHLQGDQSVARRSSPRAASNSPSRQSTALGSISIEGFFSKLARSVLRHIRVASKQELKERIMAAIDDFNRNPVIHTWTYKLDAA